MRAWSIYGLRSSHTAEIRYVGYSVNPRRRLRDHMQAAKAPRFPVHHWIRALLGRGESPELVILETGNGNSWQAAERNWIAHFKSPRLLNRTIGGEHFNVSDEARARAGLKLRDRVFTTDHRRRISEAKKGQPRPDAAEIIRRVAANNRGKRMSLTEHERARRSAIGKEMSSHLRRWSSLSPEEQALRRLQASEQMRRVWAQRKAKSNADGSSK